MAITRTFELYLTGPDGVRTFEALTCKPMDVIARVRSRLAGGGIVSVEVWEMGRHLYTLMGAPGDG